MPPESRLPRSFFLQPTVAVAQQLLGKKLVFNSPRGLMSGIITETEAYLTDDPASHAFKGQTRRNASMFLDAGYSYVYRIYGIHYCLNLVTQAKGVGEAVLIRALRPVSGFEKDLNGPGRVCKTLGITIAQDGIDTVTSKSLYVMDVQTQIEKFETRTRVGITKAAEELLRFTLKT